MMFIYVGLMFITTAGMVLASLLNPQLSVLIARCSRSSAGS